MAQTVLQPILTQTPVQELHLDGLRNRIFVKRDDLLPYSFGGNKVRIGLEFLRDCITGGCDAMIIYGDRRSNLCRVLAQMCRMNDMPCVMIETSEHGEDGPAPFNEIMIASLGVRILPCAKDRIAQTVDKAFALLEGEGRHPYYIYGNRLGTGNEGTAGLAYLKASEEITDWEEQTGHRLDYVFTACGTGSTQGGLVAGMHLRRQKTEVVGISISSRTQERAYSAVWTAASAALEKAGCTDTEGLKERVQVETRYSCGGYGARDSRVTDLIGEVYRRSSVPLDPTYTGKAMRGMLDYLDEHGIEGRQIMFLHTGGTPLFFDELARSGNAGFNRNPLL